MIWNQLFGENEPLCMTISHETECDCVLPVCRCRLLLSILVSANSYSIEMTNDVS